MNKRLFLIIIIILIIIGILFFNHNNYLTDKQSTKIKLNELVDNTNSKNMKISSPAFENNNPIPKRYTCDGENINPPLLFEDVPLQTQSLILIIDDPDAPIGTFLHWLVFNIPPKTRLIEENSVPSGAIVGKNDFNQNKYSGPCPPSGEHRYFFHLYALDTLLDLKENANLTEIKANIRDHLLAEAELIGLYQR